MPLSMTAWGSAKALLLSHPLALAICETESPGPAAASVSPHHLFVSTLSSTVILESFEKVDFLLDLTLLFQGLSLIICIYNPITEEVSIFFVFLKRTQ